MFGLSIVLQVLMGVAGVVLLSYAYAASHLMWLERPSVGQWLVGTLGAVLMLSTAVQVASSLYGLVKPQALSAVVTLALCLATCLGIYCVLGLMRRKIWEPFDSWRLSRI